MAFQRSEESLRKNKNEETNKPRYNERRDRDSEGHRLRYGVPVDNSSFRGGDNYDRRDYNNMPYNSMQYNNMNYNSMNYNNGKDYNSMNYNNRPNYSMQYDNRPPYNHPTQYTNRPPYGDSRMRPFDSRRRGGHKSGQRENKRFVKKSKEQLDKELAAYMACGSTTDQ